MVVRSSNLFDDADSSSSDESTKLSVNKWPVLVDDCLKCNVCNDYFVKPRILPCGHTFCKKCVLFLREKAVHDFNKMRDPNAHRRGDCGFFRCPWPTCQYTMRIMNVSRWTLKNKVLSKAVAAVKRPDKENRDIGSQTQIGGNSLIISLPAKLFLSSTTKISSYKMLPSSATSTVVQHVLQNIVAMDTMDIKHCQPPGDIGEGLSNWKSLVYMFGMTILDQAIKMTQ